ncbi:regulatory protein RecX [Marinagarivorans algicola]|uniref:regulatory protein RecX n=1 Tax=Marinagarivorans algicola TaxID=1513270 RepID=UPI0006B9E228|nr:regulatory protein RecX [Marinagarivorans algicola]
MNDELTEPSELYRWLYHKGIELLARREHGRSELQTKLQQKLTAHKRLKGEMAGPVNVAMTQVLDKLECYDYLNDERFVQAYVNSRINKGYGINRIQQELKQKGLADQLIDRHLSARDDGPLEDSMIYRTWYKKFRILAKEPKDRAKQQRFLLYRGFSHHEVSRLFDYLKSV